MPEGELEITIDAVVQSGRAGIVAIVPANARHVNKSGDIVDLEVPGGPIDLAVSGVNAVRKWSPSLPAAGFEVQTEILVNYFLSGF